MPKCVSGHKPLEKTLVLFTVTEMPTIDTTSSSGCLVREHGGMAFADKNKNRKKRYSTQVDFAPKMSTECLGSGIFEGHT